MTWSSREKTGNVEADINSKRGTAVTQQLSIASNIGGGVRGCVGGCVRGAGKSRGSQRARLMEISRNKYQTEIVIKTLRGEKVN